MKRISNATSLTLAGLLASTIAFSASGQTTDPPVLKAVKTDSATPVLLQWSSDPTAIYAVYCSSNLLDWQVAIDNFPAQGTNTLWTDYGVEMGDDSRPASNDSDAPYRFYRVALQSYMSNAAPITVTISNIPSGALLSGPTNVIAGASTTEDILANYLYVDGDLVGQPGAPLSQAFPIDTRFYPNGPHRLSVAYENDGDAGTTGGDDPVTDLGAGYGVANVSVTFSNFLSNFRARYRAFRPDLGQTEEIYATWGTPRSWKVTFTPFNDTNTEIRSFTGCGIRVLVQWDGLDTNGAPVPAQLLAATITDLGACTPPPSSSGDPGDSDDPPSPSQLSIGSASANWYPTAMSQALRAGLTSYYVQPPPMPPARVQTNGTWAWVPWEDVYGPHQATEVQISQAAQDKFQQSLTARALSPTPSGPSPDGPGDGPSGESASLPIFINKIGTYAIGFQGHHPFWSPANRPARGLPFGQATMTSSSQPPWGKVHATYRIARSLQMWFPMMGYQRPPSGYIHGDDVLTVNDMKKSSLGGNHFFDEANIGLYIGHSAGERETIVALGHRQTYIPIYNSAAGTITWIGMNDMRWGGSNLKWLAFYSCNIFRDDPRDYPCYPVMKSNSHLAMGGQLHIMQGYITESTIHSGMGYYWTYALSGKTGVQANHTVIGAWKYVCRHTQPKLSKDPNQNICRSIFWPECEGDYVYGYGTQTDPSGGHLQIELQESDGTANDAEP